MSTVLNRVASRLSANGSAAHDDAEIGADLAARFRMVTPAIATAWLSRNTSNRPSNQATVNLYSRELFEGRWKTNGEAIKFSRDGTLLDGQHRLLACVATGVPFVTLVVTGLDPDVFPTLDRGRKRTLAENLAMLGLVNTTILGAALGYLWRYENNLLTATGPGRYPSVEVALDVLGRHPGIIASVTAGMKLNRLTSGSLMAFCHYAFAQKDRELADWFMEQLALPTNLEPDVPVYALHRRLQDNRASKARLPIEPDIFAMTIKAWNLTRQGKRVRWMGWRRSGPHAEAFPSIQ